MATVCELRDDLRCKIIDSFPCSCKSFFEFVLFLNEGWIGYAHAAIDDGVSFLGGKFHFCGSRGERSIKKVHRPPFFEIQSWDGCANKGMRSVLESWCRFSSGPLDSSLHHG